MLIASIAIYSISASHGALTISNWDKDTTTLSFTLTGTLTAGDLAVQGLSQRQTVFIGVGDGTGTGSVDIVTANAIGTTVDLGGSTAAVGNGGFLGLTIFETIN